MATNYNAPSFLETPLPLPKPPTPQPVRHQTVSPMTSTPLPRPPTIQAPPAIRNIKKSIHVPPLLRQTFDEWWHEELKAKQRIALETNTPELRADSFEKHQWPLKYPSPQQIIEGGFYLKPDDEDEDLTLCHTCGVKIFAWEKNEDPYETHLKYSPHCPWLKEHHEELMAGRKHACRRCPAKFPSNTKLHIHVQDHHQKKAEKPTSEAATPTPSEAAMHTPSETAMPTPFATPPPSEPALVLTPPNTPSKSSFKPSHPMTPPPTPPLAEIATPATPIATPKKAISWAEIASRSVIAPKPSRLPIPTPKSVPKRTETAPNTCPPTPAATPLPKPTLKHQKPYLTIHDLFEMFAEKPKIKGLVRTKKRASSPKFSYQARITSYFKPAANRDLSINQASETPNSMSFQQHTPAESTRIKSLPIFTKPASEKTAISPYKMPSIFDRLLFVPSSRNDSLSSPIFRAPFDISDFSHVCHICSDIFESNNGLHRHLRDIHFDQVFRQRHEIFRKQDREFDRK